MPNYNVPGSLGASIPPSVALHEFVKAFDNETPAAGQASQQYGVAPSPNGGITGLSIEAAWGGVLPSAAVVNLQIANTDVDADYVTVSTLTFTGTQTALRDDPAGLTAKFVRAQLVSNTGGTLLTVRIGH